MAEWSTKISQFFNCQCLEEKCVKYEQLLCWKIQTIFVLLLVSKVTALDLGWNPIPWSPVFSFVHVYPMKKCFFDCPEVQISDKYIFLHQKEPSFCWPPSWFSPSPLLFASLAVFMVQFRVGQPWLGKTLKRNIKWPLFQEIQIIHTFFLSCPPKLQGDFFHWYPPISVPKRKAANHNLSYRQDLQEQQLWLAGWQFSFWCWNWGIPVKKITL